MDAKHKTRAALWHRMNLRGRLLTIMMIVALAAVLICAVAFSVTLSQMLSGSREDAQALSRNVHGMVEQAFYQQETHIRGVYTVSQASLLNRRLEELETQGKAPDWNALVSEAYDLVNNIYDVDLGILESEGGMVFIMADDTLFVHGVDVQVFTDAIDRFYVSNPIDGDFLSELHKHQGYAAYLEGDEGMLLSWSQFGEGAFRIGLLVPNTQALRMSEALQELIEYETGVAVENITKTARRSAIGIVAAIVLLVIALPLASRRLALVVVNPVEREQERQHNLLRVAEEEKAMLERLDQLKTEFLGNVSHELKTPLTVVSGHAQLLGSQLAGEEHAAARDKSRIISSEADRLALMVGQVLDVTRIEENRLTVEKRSCHIDELIYKAVEMHFPILNKADNRLEINAALDLPEVACDPNRITQVLVNLVANALRHTEQGEITITAKESSGFMEVSVSDTGAGIAHEELSHLFTRYRPGSGETGTGLGLYICKYLVEEHGGKIRVESSVGQGTTVTFSLPL